MMRGIGLAVVIGTAAVGMLGCPAATTLGMARTLDQGKIQGYVATTTIGYALQGDDEFPGHFTATPSIEGGFRYGLTDTAEIGARLGFFGLELQSKFALVRSPTLDSGVDFSIAPAIGVGISPPIYGPPTYTASVTLPFLVGINLGGNQLVLGPKIVDQSVFGNGGAVSSFSNLIHVGGSVGYAIRIAPNFRVLPEVSVMAPVVQFSEFGTLTRLNWITYQLGFGFLFGGFNE